MSPAERTADAARRRQAEKAEREQTKVRPVLDPTLLFEQARQLTSFALLYRKTRLTSSSSRSR